MPTLRNTVPLTVFFFDALRVAGADLPHTERHAALAAAVPPSLVAPSLLTTDPEQGEEFFADALRRSHEGVVVKAAQAPYAAGRRGAGWIKVKPRHTLDLVVLAAEWGSGRRSG